MQKNDIQSLMSGSLGNWLDSQAGMRAEAKSKAHWRWTIAAAVALPALSLLWFGPDWGGEIKFWLSAVAIGLGAFWGYIPIAEAKKHIKVGINSAIADMLGLAYEHDIEPGADFETAKTYGLVPRFHRSGFEDRWSGELEGHDFALFEAHLEERRRSGKNTRYVTVFRGAIVRMVHGRPFHSTTLLQRAGKHKKWLGLGGRKDVAKFDGHELAYVDQVHPDFEDIFEVWSDDQVEARTLIHPIYVERLIDIENAFNGKKIRALFTRGDVILAVESGDMFESGAIDPEGDHARVAECRRQFASLAELATALNQVERGSLS